MNTMPKHQSNRCAASSKAKLEVFGGSGQNARPGNMAYAALLYENINAYISGDSSAKNKLVVVFMKKFSFRDSNGNLIECEERIRKKIQSALGDVRKLGRTVATAASKGVSNKGQKKKPAPTSSADSEAEAAAVGDDEDGKKPSAKGNKIKIATRDSTAKGEKMTVLGGKSGNIHRSEGNASYAAMLLRYIKEYVNADESRKESIIDMFVDKFEFLDSKGDLMDEPDKVRGKIHRAISDERKLGKHKPAAPASLRSSPRKTVAPVVKKQAVAKKQGASKSSTRGFTAKGEKMTVLGGKSPNIHRSEANAAYAAMLLLYIKEYVSAVESRKQKIIDLFVDKFEFLDPQGNLIDEPDKVRRKIHLAVSDERKLGSQKSAETAPSRSSTRTIGAPVVAAIKKEKASASTVRPRPFRGKKLTVLGGTSSVHHRSPGNEAYAAMVVRYIPDYVNGDQSTRDGIIKKFLSKLEFLDAKGNLINEPAKLRRKLHLALGDTRKIGKSTPFATHIPVPNRKSGINSKPMVAQTVSSNSFVQKKQPSHRKLTVLGGKGAHGRRSSGNKAFATMLDLHVDDYVEGDKSTKEAILALFRNNFEFLDKAGKVEVRETVDRKLHLALKDIRKLGKTCVAATAIAAPDPVHSSMGDIIPALARRVSSVSSVRNNAAANKRQSSSNGASVARKEPRISNSASGNRKSTKQKRKIAKVSLAAKRAKIIIPAKDGNDDDQSSSSADNLEEDHPQDAASVRRAHLLRNFESASFITWY